ncbi:CRISPR-associated protein Cas4 [Luteolibacter algae]|uniref:CRISPR-associated exonuclease Cas4 n=1 Tax=Luteolibacter algae TaxID=454151 RepID=A0ABW5D593_9BACT
MDSSASAIPLSALQHYLYCPRQCALIHNEQIWAENRFTAEGQLLHKKANEGPDEHRSSGSILRHLHVSSNQYGLSGICDIVEKQRDGNFVPVEYKRGKPKAHRADEVQVCAQAICLEEMFHTKIPVGLIFYGKTRRRIEVRLDETLRTLTLSTVSKVRRLKECETTPSAEYDPGKCAACSLIDLCQPRALRFKRGASAWFLNRLQSTE